MEVSARFAEENEILSEERYSVMDTEVGKLYIPRYSVHFGEKIALDLWKFMWMNGISIYGVKALASVPAWL